MWMRDNNKWLGNSRLTKRLSICVSENLLNGDSPYPQMGPIGKVLPLPTPVEIAERTDGNGSDDDIGSSPVSSLDKRHAHTHTMSTRRVCWHRNTSISMTEHSLSVRVNILCFFLFQDDVRAGQAGTGSMKPRPFFGASMPCDSLQCIQRKLHF